MAERVPPGYTTADVARLVAEGGKTAHRSPFARDRARVVHSSALRRLAARTQVLGPSADDFVRNRLTHSLEVAQVGRELGQALGADPDVVDAACLSHDIGHPPFGHDGETALDEVAAGCGGFEANAQTLRLLTRLEAKTAHPDGRPAGLNLTRASLDAATKYPWTRAGAALAAAGRPGSPVGSHVKFGVYADDVDVFTWLRDDRVGVARCIEAQVMDFADDVAYSVHDVEDAVVGGALDLRVLTDPAVVVELARVCRDRYVPDVTDSELAAARDGLTGPGWWPRLPYDGTRAALAGLKDVTSRLVGRFTGAALDATGAALAATGSALPATRYAADLVVPRETAVTIALLKSLAARFVMDVPEHVARRERQREVLLGLCAALAAGGPDLLEPPFAADLAAASDDGARLRVVVDQVASLTDVSALVWHERLLGGIRTSLV